MLTLVRKAINATCDAFGIQLRRKTLLTKADDPYHAISLLLDRQETKTIIDAGASIGDTSQRLTELFPHAVIHAIEPYPPFFQKIEAIAARNPHIRPAKLALSNHNGHAQLQINQSEGTNSLLPSSQDDLAYGDQLAPKGKIQVETQTLDTFVSQKAIEFVDFLKLDLQGGELSALRGASKTMKTGSIRCILCEIMFAKHYENQPTAGALLHELIEKYSFTLFNLFQPHYHHGRLLQADALLMHSSIPASIERRIALAFHAHSRLPLRIQ